MLKNILTQAFDQYVFDRVNDILLTAGTADAKYGKAVSDVRATLTQLMNLAWELKAQHPELLDLVMDYETFTAFESGLAAEIAYRQGLQDQNRIRQEFSAFIQEELTVAEKS
ncbi:hypothetical protein P22_2936 [Propionispora sp. 2/2-37]|uniref:hypothetical protein n=1 Tax=Propionispora sp. 2/2-37 TaxID=1677858 RepID=UPI0006BB980D|nr:hypothetical protein [Propionispora sp. 2/2-37]CUH96825.1 hypothetical protein P22_2936 [Propionispora sp. 2/2-37]